MRILPTFLIAASTTGPENSLAVVDKKASQNQCIKDLIEMAEIVNLMTSKTRNIEELRNRMTVIINSEKDDGKLPLPLVKATIKIAFSIDKLLRHVDTAENLAFFKNLSEGGLTGESVAVDWDGVCTAQEEEENRKYFEALGKSAKF